MVDYIRRPYSTLARFFKDDEGPPVIIQWYKAAPGAPVLGRGTSFMSLDWTSETTKVINPNWPDLPWEQRPGEMFEAARPFSPWPTPIGLNYAHVCGTEDEFIDGAVFDPGREVKYDEQGLPLCCGGPIVPAFPLEVGFAGELEEVSPGPDCETAQLTTPGATNVFEVEPGESQWWHLVVPVPDVICFRVVAPSPATTHPTFRIFRGLTLPCPGGLVRQESGTLGLVTTIPFGTANPLVWVQVRNDSASPVPYGFIVQGGACV